MYFSMENGVPTVGEQPLLCTVGEQVRPSNKRGERANVGHYCKGSIAYTSIINIFMITNSIVFIIIIIIIIIICRWFHSDQLAIVMEYTAGSPPCKSLELPVLVCQF